MTTPIWNYTAPVYSSVLLYAYMHGLDWAAARGKDPETFVRNNYRQLDLGRGTGKTTAIVTFCDNHDGCIVVCQTVEYANNLRRRHNVRAFGSGDAFAMAAMDFGKTAKQAVKYAMTRDSATGGKIRTFRLRSK